MVQMWKGDLSTDNPVGWIDINDERPLNENRRKMRAKKIELKNSLFSSR